MFKKSYKGRRIKFAAKKSLAVPVAIVTSFYCHFGSITVYTN